MLKVWVEEDGKVERRVLMNPREKHLCKTCFFEAGKRVAMSQTANIITCPSCKRTMRLLAEDEAFRRAVLPELRITRCGELSAEIPRDLWNKVAKFFEFEDFAKAADLAEDCDDFTESERYRELLQYKPGTWVLKDISDAPKVEELLGILPHNRRAVLDVKEQRKAEEEHEREARREAREDRMRNLKFRLFRAEDGEYIPISETFDGRPQGRRIKWQRGFNAYGSGEEFLIDVDGEHCWHLRNNGMDGDDWSRNNIVTAGAGAIGLRFKLTPERKAFLDELLAQTE